MAAVPQRAQPPTEHRHKTSPSANHHTQHGITRMILPQVHNAAVQLIHLITQSVGAMGGVYKGQGRNQHELMTHTYLNNRC